MGGRQTESTYHRNSNTLAIWRFIPSVTSDIRNVMKTIPRKLTKTWESAVDFVLRGDQPYYTKVTGLNTILSVPDDFL